ncbi:MAG: 4,5-DOPA dioxygenase extradiol [Chloroflexi bacterium]|nr:4,5-DOPA dioxygenase extradiol [Chloroflexota bacterium]
MSNKLRDLDKMIDVSQSSEAMPVLFVGHGSPMNAIEDNDVVRMWGRVGSEIPKPRAILCVSAHWETRGTRVTAMEKPRTIHDFGGFPRELFDVQYPAPGSMQLAQETHDVIQLAEVYFDHSEWGLDHGCWSVLNKMFPAADVPVVQISLDVGMTPQQHFALARELAALRRRGVLIFGSGNMVHNLRRIALPAGSTEGFNTRYGLDWALEANMVFKELIDAGRFDHLADYKSLGRAVQLAVPTPEHYLPMLYTLALKDDDDGISYFNDYALAGSLTMTSMMIDKHK